MAPIDIIALIFIVLILVKVAVVFRDPKSWMGVVKSFYSKPTVTMTAGLVGAAVILCYLLKELTIVQVFAAMTFMMALMMIQFAAYGDAIIELSNKFLKDRNLIKKAWLSTSIWLILMAWVLYEIFV